MCREQHILLVLLFIIIKINHAITAQKKIKKKKIKNFLVKNWKTSIAGVIVAIATYLKVANIIDANAFTLIGSLTTAIGLMLAKDSDKTGEK